MKTEHYWAHLFQIVGRLMNVYEEENQNSCNDVHMTGNS